MKEKAVLAQFSLPTFSALSKRKRLIVEQVCNGVTQEAIAADLETTREAVAQALSKPAMKEAVREMRHFREEQFVEVNRDFADEVKGDLRKAWVELMRIVESKVIKPQVRLSAIDSVLDRSGMSRTSKSENVNEIKGLGEEKREELYKSVLALHKGGKK